MVKNAWADAPDPAILVNTTWGCVIYPAPPETICKSITLNPTVSNQNFQGYVCINGLFTEITPSATFELITFKVPLANTGGRSKSVIAVELISGDAVFVYWLIYSLILVL